MTGREDVQRVAVSEGALGDGNQTASVAALFPHVVFETTGQGWPKRVPSGCNVIVVRVDGSSAMEIDEAKHGLRALGRGVRVLITLHNADVSTTRLLMREGAADVIPAPSSEAALAVSLDKLLGSSTGSGSGRAGGEIVAVLKAGGGVGATTIAVQTGIMAASRGAKVCVTDLDLQFGAVSVYLDMPDAATVSDCLAAGSGLKDMSFESVLGKHRSGVTIVAAPRQVTPLEALAPPQTATLLDALRRSFDLTILDLPAVWTAWTNRALQAADRIVIVTHLSVPHLHMLSRQIATLRAQGLEDHQLTLVCNALCGEQTASLSIKSAERAIGHAFDVVVPEERKLFYAAHNQGVDLAAVRGGSKAEKAIGQLASLLTPQAEVRGRR